MCLSLRYPIRAFRAPSFGRREKHRGHTCTRRTNQDCPELLSWRFGFSHGVLRLGLKGVDLLIELRNERLEILELVLDGHGDVWVDRGCGRRGGQRRRDVPRRERVPILTPRDVSGFSGNSRCDWPEPMTARAMPGLSHTNSQHVLCFSLSGTSYSSSFSVAFIYTSYSGMSRGW